MLVIPGLPSYNGVEVYYLKGVIRLPIVISFRDRWYVHIFFCGAGVGGGGGNGLIDDVIVICWTDSDFKISRALGASNWATEATFWVYSGFCQNNVIENNNNILIWMGPFHKNV